MNKHLFVKRHIALLFLLAIAMTTMADSAERGIWKMVKLANGQEVKAELRGDEYMSYWQAEDGRCFVKKAGTQHFEVANMAQLEAKAMQLRAENPLPQPMATTTQGKRRVALGADHPPFIGQKKGLIILVEFTDMKFRAGHNAEYYSHVANDLNFTNSDGFVGSIRDYFLSQSYGMFDLTFDVVGPISLKYNMAYYGAPTTTGAHDKNARDMVREAARGAADILGSFEDYDWFGDGYVDQVFIIYAGRGQSSGGNENTIWPHRSSITALRLGGKLVQTYACANEMHSETSVHGIGTFCHEFSHCLGLPDLYDTKGSDSGEKLYGMASWDLMGNGNYLGNTFRPCSYSGYERSYCGWKEPVILDKDTTVTNMKGISEGGDYYIVYNDGNKDEFYILENRSQKGWDAAQYGAGMLITHVDYNKTVWSKNVVNAISEGVNDHPRYTPILADNNTSSKYTTDVAGDLYPWNRNNMLTNYTRPASTLYNPNTDGTYFMSKPIKNITRNADGTIYFEFSKEEDKQIDPLPQGTYFRETFCRTNGIGGNEDVWNPAEMSLIYLIPDNLEWTFNNSIGAKECAVVGSNARSGSATTPAFTIAGPSIISFKTAAYGAEGSTQLTLSADGNATLGETKFAMEMMKWSEYSTTLTAPAYPATLSITFKNNKKRFFLDEIYVQSEESAGISDIMMETQPLNSRIFTIDGRYAGSNTKALAPGLYIRNGRKFIVK